MLKRDLIIVGLVMATVACAVPVVAYLFRDPINQSSCERIKDGMTEAEVIQILGRPCDDAGASEQSSNDFQEGQWHESIRRGTGKIWNGPAGTLEVEFDESGIVKGVAFGQNEDSVWLRIRRWMGLAPTPKSLSGAIIGGP